MFLHPKLLNKIARLMKAASGGAGPSNNKCTSGSLTDGSMRKLMQAILQDRGVPASELHFYDVGAGDGYAVLWSAVAGCGTASGCELAVNGHLSLIFENAKRIMAEKHPETAEAISNASIQFTDFQSVPKTANLVFSFNAVFSPPTQERLVEELRKADHVQYAVYFKNGTYSTTEALSEALEGCYEFVARDGSCNFPVTMQGSHEGRTAWILRRV